MQFFTKGQRSALSSGNLPAAIQVQGPSPTSSIPNIPQPLSREQSFAFLNDRLRLIPGDNRPTNLSTHTLFLSIDIEGGGRHGERLNEVGISIFNTASLSSTLLETESSILSYNFRLQSKNGYVKYSNEFLFGITEDTPLDETKGLFRRIALGGQVRNPIYESDGVEIVLVGHSIMGDVRIMERYIPGLWENAHIATIIDLQVLHGGMKLSRVLDSVNLGNGKHRGLHCGGNDANYSLRALLLTAVNLSANIADENSMNQERAEKINKVALDLLPKLKSKRNHWNLLCLEKSLDALGADWGDFIFASEKRDKEYVELDTE